MRFIAVTHNWHVHSNGFTVDEFEADSVEDAVEKGYAIQARLDVDFSRAATKVVQIEPYERVARKLTWKERLTGNLSVINN